jgi:hypothetical protein
MPYPRDVDDDPQTNRETIHSQLPPWSNIT